MHAARRLSAGLLDNATAVPTQQQKQQQAATTDYIVMTPYPVEPGHTLIIVNRIRAADWRTEYRANAAYVAAGDNAGIIINKAASISEYNKTQNSQKDYKQPMSAKMSFKVSLLNAETGKASLEHRTLRFWLNITSKADVGVSKLASNTGAINELESSLMMSSNDDSNVDLNRSLSHFKAECSHVAQTYFCLLVGAKPDDDFPKNYAAFLMKLMRLLKEEQFKKIYKMEVEVRQLTPEEKPPSRASSIDSGQTDNESSGRGSPLSGQKILDIVESSYPNSISIHEICSITQTSEDIVRQFINDLTQKEKINTIDGQHYTRVTINADTKVSLVKQMPKVVQAKQPVIAIITAQFCEKLAVDAMISDKETFVKYRTTTEGESSNYVYTLGNIGDHRVVSTKLTSIGHSRAALIAAGNATTRLLGTFPEIEYVFLVGCAGGVANYTNFATHVRLGDVVVSSLPDLETSPHLLQAASPSVAGDLTTNANAKNDKLKFPNNNNNISLSLNDSNSKQQYSPDYIYVLCKAKQSAQQNSSSSSTNQSAATNPALAKSISIHSNLKAASNSNNASSAVNTGVAPFIGATAADKSCVSNNSHNNDELKAKPLEFDDCHFRFWCPTRFELQELAHKLWLEGLDNPRSRIWEYYIEEGIKSLKQQQDVDASRPPADTDKLFMSIGGKGAIEVNHPDPNDDENEIDFRKDGKPMCHFCPIGSGKAAVSSDQIRQRMVSEFGLRAFDTDFEPVIESIYGNRKENYIMIRGISDYKEGRKKREWQQYSALVAAAFMKSLVVSLKPVD